MSLARATRSELTKQFTTSMWWILAVVLVLYIGPTAAGLAAVFALNVDGSLDQAGGGMPPLPADMLPAMVYSLATAIGYVFPLLIGTLLVTGEFRHLTLTPTFLAVPRRGIALGGKLLAGVVMGALYGVIAVVITVGPGAALLAAFGVDPLLGEADTWAMIGRMLLAMIIWVIVGIGIGTLVRNQVAAVVGVIAFTQFLEPILRMIGGFVDGVSEATQYLPGAASDALVGASIFTGLTGATTDVAALEWWIGGLVLLGYGVVLVVLGHLVSWRRDVN